MLKAVYFVDQNYFDHFDDQKCFADQKNVRHTPEVISEIDRAVKMLETAGFMSGVLKEEQCGSVNRQETLFLCGDARLLGRLAAEGFYVTGYANADNAGEHFSGVPYIVQEPDLVDPDSYIKIYQRAAGLPWTILRTEHCLVREFTLDDLDGIYSLYDDQARRFLEPPSEDRAREKEILRAYIDRIYGLYGFGHWAVTALNMSGTSRGNMTGSTCGDMPGDLCGQIPDGKLIGRVGFAAITAEQELEAREMGISCPDADFGFLISRQCRGKGIAYEVCRALIRYGFEELGFARIRADAKPGNAASLRLLHRLGFIQAGTSPDGRHVFYLDYSHDRSIGF